MKTADGKGFREEFVHNLIEALRRLKYICAVAPCSLEMKDPKSQICALI